MFENKQSFESLESRAHFSLTPSLVEVPISAAAIASDPNLANYRSFDLRINITPNDHFSVAGMEANLSQGAFYQHPLGGHTPVTAAWGLVPALEFDTFLTAPNGSPVNFMMPGVAGGEMFTPTRASVDWAPGPGIRTGSGEHTIARLTVSREAAGTLLVGMYSYQQPTTLISFGDFLPKRPGQAPALVTGSIFTGPGSSLGYSGWTAYHDANLNGVLDAGETTSVTSLHNYSLTGDRNAYALVVPAGGATIRVQPPPGYSLHGNSPQSITLKGAPGGVHTRNHFIGAPAASRFDLAQNPFSQRAVDEPDLLDVVA